MGYLFANCNKLSLLEISNEEDLFDKTKVEFENNNLNEYNSSKEKSNLYDNIDSSYTSSSLSIYKNKDDDDIYQKDLLFINSHITRMMNLFYNCNSLILLPDISKWNTSNVSDMSNIFCNCNSLLSLPDISK